MAKTGRSLAVAIRSRHDDEAIPRRDDGRRRCAGFLRADDDRCRHRQRRHVQTEGNYPTRAACQDAEPGVKASTPGNWNNFWCVPDRNVNGNWKLVLSN
jgi:hypothetical protein